MGGAGGWGGNGGNGQMREGKGGFIGPRRNTFWVFPWCFMGVTLSGVSESDPLNMDRHGPLYLGTDQPFFRGQKELQIV